MYTDSVPPLSHTRRATNRTKPSGLAIADTSLTENETGRGVLVIGQIGYPIRAMIQRCVCVYVCGRVRSVIIMTQERTNNAR